MKSFGNMTIVTSQEYPEGIIIELAENYHTLHARKYERKKNYYGEEYDYDVTEEYEIGNVNDFFFDKKGNLRKEEEITDELVHELIYAIGLYPEGNGFMVDDSVSNFYDQLIAS